MRCAGVEQDDAGATLRFVDTASGAALEAVRADAVVACDGIHSALRKQCHPHEGDPRYTGVMMWRGTTVWPSFLSGGSMVRAGWLSTGKMVIYPIRDDVDGAGSQLVNWVAEIQAPQRERERDWNRRGALDDFLWAFEDWHFDWLDVPELIRRSQMVLEFPMVDQEPLERWTFGRVTLLGDAAHPMVPRGSNGAGQAIVDARVMARLLTEHDDPRAAFAEYEALRRPATATVVRTNRQNPPDAIIREVVERTGDAPFANIADVISQEELVAMSESYKRVAGYDKDSLAASSTS
jgi:2-polyprenyl-6-methoxyphenol hydroxylase-like FAD-dependent oxidoreductase